MWYAKGAAESHACPTAPACATVRRSYNHDSHEEAENKGESDDPTRGRFMSGRVCFYITPEHQRDKQHARHAQRRVPAQPT